MVGFWVIMPGRANTPNTATEKGRPNTFKEDLTH